MNYYARVVLRTNASSAARLDDMDAARRWIEQEHKANPRLFRLGQIMAGAPDRDVVATFDSSGWDAASAGHAGDERVAGGR